MENFRENTLLESHGPSLMGGAVPQDVAELDRGLKRPDACPCCRWTRWTSGFVRTDAADFTEALTLL